MGKAAYLKPARRGQQTGPGSSRPLPGDPPEPAGRRHWGTASLAGRGRPKAPYLWGQSTQHKVQGMKGPQRGLHDRAPPCSTDTGQDPRVGLPSGPGTRPPCLEGLGLGHSDPERTACRARAPSHMWKERGNQSLSPSSSESPRAVTLGYPGSRWPLGHSL